MLAMRKRPYSLADFKADKPAQPQVRKDFPDAIYWVADVVTDARGEATVQVTYPDALTTWRLTARGATADTRVGQAVARTTVTKDLIVRVITPRFLTEGDDVVTPVIAHNYLPGERAIDLTLTATGPDARRRARRATRRRADGRRGTPRLALHGRRGRARHRDRHGHDRPAIATRSSSASPCCLSGSKREIGTSGSLTGAGTATATLAIPAHSNPAARTIEVALAPSLAGSMLGALDFLTWLSLRLHRADALVVSAQPRRRAHAGAAEAHADRAAVAARSPGDRRRHAAARLPARRRRVGVVEDGREPSRS